MGMMASSCAPQGKPRVRKVVTRRPAPAYAKYIPWGEHSVDSRVTEIGKRARRHWQRHFDALGVSYPGPRVVFVAYKRERQIEVYAGPSRAALQLLRRVPVSAASGGPGPKLREGDRQVPEGVYEVDSLNPNSRFHVALRLDYPNSFDRMMGDRDRRTNLGGDIMIHGGDQSIGCLAVGDQVAEDLFVLAADAGIENVTVIIVPRDFRRTGETNLMPGQPEWVHELYSDLSLQLRSLPRLSPNFAGEPTYRAAQAPRRAEQRR